MAEPRSRWQRMRHWLMKACGELIVLVALVALAYAVYAVIVFGWSWTGFVGGDGIVAITTTEHGVPTATQHLPVKTLWDWMQLLLVPVMLAIGGFWLNQLQKNREERTTAQRDKVEREIAADSQQETALQVYIDKIGELLLREREHLGSPPSNLQVETIARARTVTVLRRLDPVRRASLLRFLNQANILWLCTEGKLSEVDLQGADLAQIDLSKANLSRANLSKADLRSADLSEAWLRDADLRGADLNWAKLRKAWLRDADLREVNFTREGLDSTIGLQQAHLSGANLNGIVLQSINLERANFSYADLSGANLSEAWLQGAWFLGANLSRANLSRADLHGANLHGAGLISGILSGLPFSISDADLQEANLHGANLSEIDLHGINLRGAKGLTDEQWADYRARGALVDPVSPAPTSPAPVSLPVPSMPQSDGEQDLSPTPAQAAETPPAADDTTPPM